MPLKALLLVDHGSRRAASNAMLECVARLVQLQVGSDVVVLAAHMEIASPSVAEGFAQCVAAGATEVIVHPYLLAEGRHAAEDIPRLVTEAAAAHPGVTFRVTASLGVHPKIGEVVLERAGLTPVEDVCGAPTPNACPRDPNACDAPWCRLTDRSEDEEPWG